eukprot:3684-Chlamydomonas_euryale.AAC.1
MQPHACPCAWASIVSHTLAHARGLRSSATRLPMRVGFHPQPHACACVWRINIWNVCLPLTDTATHSGSACTQPQACPVAWASTL